MTDASRTLFASPSLREHVLRGAVGPAALAGALELGQPGASWGALALALVAGSLVAFRGCPVCWTIGLAKIAAPCRTIPCGERIIR